MMIVSPDEGAHGPQHLLSASVLGLDMGMFYKRRDYTRIVNGRNPIVAHEYLGDDVEGKDMSGRRTILFPPATAFWIWPRS